MIFWCVRSVCANAIMSLRGAISLLTVAVIAIILFFSSAISVGDSEQERMDTPQNCLRNVSSISSGRCNGLDTQGQFIRINFKLKFGCKPPTFIDQGVRLEIRVLSTVSSNTVEWFPVRYYTQNLDVPRDYKTLVELDSSNNSVVAESLLYMSSLPLFLVKSSESVSIQECLCGLFLQNSTNSMQLEIRWMQRFGSSSVDNSAGWILDDIEIRIWNGKCFLQVLNEDFSGNGMLITESYNLKSAKLQRPSCGSPGNDTALVFSKGASNLKTRRSIVITQSLSYESESCEDGTELTLPTRGEELVSQLFSDGDSEKLLNNLIDLYNGSLPQEISDIVISSAADFLKSISTEDDSEAGGRVLKLLDLFALRGYNSSHGKVSNDIYTFDVKKVSPDDFMKPMAQLEALHESEGTISLPGELFSASASKSQSGIRVASFVYQDLSGILPEDTDDVNTNHTQLGSPVLSSSLWCTDRPCKSGDLKNPVLFQIHHFRKHNASEVPGCYFFDLEKNIWSSRGCNLNSTLSNSTFSVCECNHLTHFAILLSPGLEIDDKNQLALEIISSVGTSISIFCMIATICILTFLKTLWGMRTFIHINLCICLIISQVIFISAIDETSIEELCQAIAIVLHYFWLTTFMWMLMEGVVLYVVLLHVFVKRQYLYIIGFTVASYGLPAVYVFCVTVPLGLINTDNQGHPHYGSSNVSKACWLRYDTHFIWAFITPIIIILIINIGFFTMAISIMWKQKKRGTGKSKLKDSCHWLKAGFSLVVIMGITWIPGILVFHKYLIFAAYIFTIATAFQGINIFILFVVLSVQVKDQYNSWWRGKKGESEFLSKLFSSSGSDRMPASPTKIAKKEPGEGYKEIQMMQRSGKSFNFNNVPGNDINMLNNQESDPNKGISNLSSSQGKNYSISIEENVTV